MTTQYRHYNQLVTRITSLIALLLLCQVSTAMENRAVTSSDGTEVTFNRYPADGDALFIWLPSETGIQESEHRAAEALAAAGHETWLVDLFESRFLPLAASSLDRIPAIDITVLISAALEQKRNIYLISSGRGSLPLLRGLHLWQQQHPDSLATPSVILLSPKFYYETPDPGQEARLLPIVKQTNALLFILQPALSPWRWKLEHTIPALEKSGSDVYVQLLRGVRDRFYFRPDATDKEQALGQRLLDAWPKKTRHVTALEDDVSPLPTGKKERELKKFAGDPLPPPLNLEGLDRQNYDLSDYRGEVVLVNFWASWCPPCVHEMPSMERLRKRLQDNPFTILAVNMAEDRQTINEFLHTKVNVTFPILLDSDGDALKRWGVFAFPTSYLIDKRGNIRYALFGSVDWERNDIVEKIEILLNE